MMVAAKPPMFTNPLALPDLPCSANERAKSMPTSDMGPPAPMTSENAISCHSGRGVDALSSTAHASAVTAAPPSTSHERRSG